MRTNVKDSVLRSLSTAILYRQICDKFVFPQRFLPLHCSTRFVTVCFTERVVSRLAADWSNYKPHHVSLPIFESKSSLGWRRFIFNNSSILRRSLLFTLLITQRSLTIITLMLYTQHHLHVHVVSTLTLSLIYNILSVPACSLTSFRGQDFLTKWIFSRLGDSLSCVRVTLFITS